MAVYLLIADDLRARFFLQDTPGIPARYDWQIPSTRGEIKYGVGNLSYINKNQYMLSGWRSIKIRTGPVIMIAIWFFNRCAIHIIFPS